ncbi:MAG: hypothetical protein Q4P22_04425 [Eubacteriales bacterium]|nr:hypothetical protein [Eubacteriales bacterium]
MKRKFLCSKKLTAVALSLALAASPAISASPVFADEAVSQKTVETSLEGGDESKVGNAGGTAALDKAENSDDEKLSSGADNNEGKSEEKKEDVAEDTKKKESKTESSKDDAKKNDSELKKAEDSKENTDSKDIKEDSEGKKAEKKTEDNAVKAEEKVNSEAAMQKLSELIDSLPSVDEIKAYGNDTEKLAKVNSILNDIAEFTENNDIEPTEEQAETMTAVADAVNEASAMTLDAQEDISGKEVTITSDTKISKDTTASLIIPSGANVTLTIDEVATLTNIAGKHTITVQSGGTLNITGGGTIDNISHARAALYNEGTVNVEYAKFVRSDEKGTLSPSYSNGGNSFYTVYNKGNMTVEDGIFENSGGYSSMLCNEGKLHIKDGYFSGGVNAIKNEGTLTIEDGQFDNSAQAVILNWNKTTINGGTFEPNDPGYASVMNGSYDSEGIININGGEFSGSIIGFGYYGEKNCNGKSINIKNGHFWNYIEAADDVSLSITGGEFEPDVYISVKNNAKKINITAEPEQKDKSFVGWFDANSNAYTGNVPATDAKYKPLFVKNEVKTDSTTDVPSKNAADTTVSNAVAEIIKNNGSSTSDVEIKTDKADLGNDIKSAISAGKAIGTQLDLKSVSESSLSEAELTAIKELAGNDNIALITDISIAMTIGGTEVANITKLPSTIEITMDIPTALQSGNRNFSVIRIHNGKAEILPTTVIAGGTKVSFRTDRFSTYALIYSDISNRGSGTRNSESSRSTANNGTWLQDNNGWWFRETDGSYPKDQWFECTWNGTDNWYHFNASGYADCGWFTDKDGQRYFLHEQHDGKFGFMYTGWNQISGQWYYFNTVTKAGAFEVASKGSLVTNGMTPDGYRVDANGAWVK